MDPVADSIATAARLEGSPAARSPIPRQRFLDLNVLSPAFHIGSYSGQLLHWGYIPAEPWRNYLHSHSFFEVCYAYQGRGAFRILGADHAVGAGDVFVARPGEPHEIIATNDDALGIYFWSYTLLPQQDQRPVGGAADALLHAFLTSPCRVCGPAGGMPQTLDLLTEEIVQRQPGYGEIVDGLIVKLILDTARAVVDVAALPWPHDPPARSTDEALVQTIRWYLRDNYHRTISLRDVAAQVHLSERHSNRLFRAATGTPIMRCLTTIRLEIAAQLLLGQQLSLKEVARLSGYPDVHHFMTLFRRHNGLTPSAFRRAGGTTHLRQG